jgi:hypothetical protein
MIRGMKIYGLLMLIDLHCALLRKPLRIFNVIFALIMAPVLLFFFAVSPREEQTKALMHGISCNPPLFIVRWLEALCSEEELSYIVAYLNHRELHK